jgi:hypothetical protein
MGTGLQCIVWLYMELVCNVLYGNIWGLVCNVLWVIHGDWFAMYCLVIHGAGV